MTEPRKDIPDMAILRAKRGFEEAQTYFTRDVQSVEAAHFGSVATYVKALEDGLFYLNRKATEYGNVAGSEYWGDIQGTERAMRGTAESMRSNWDSFTEERRRAIALERELKALKNGELSALGADEAKVMLKRDPETDERLIVIEAPDALYTFNPVDYNELYVDGSGNYRFLHRVRVTPALLRSGMSNFFSGSKILRVNWGKDFFKVVLKLEREAR